VSVKALNWAFEQTLPPALKIILLTLADYAGESGDCWPSVGAIARRATVSTRSAQRYLRELEDRGYLSRDVRERPNGSRTSNVYMLRFDMGGCQSVTGGVSTVSPPEPSYEPDLTKTSRDQSLPTADDVVTDEMLSPIQRIMASQAGIRDLDSIRRSIWHHTQRRLAASDVLTVALEILSRAKNHPNAPERYVIAALRKEPFIWQKYIDERGMAL
jgi:hypothetical protein